MTDTFIDLRELDIDVVRDIVQQAGVIWPDGQDREARLFRFNARRIVNAAFARGVASRKRMDEVIAMAFRSAQ